MSARGEAQLVDGAEETSQLFLTAIEPVVGSLRERRRVFFDVLFPLVVGARPQVGEA